jgi:uncharacterized membrane protein YkvA (DUF1232 family)
MNFMAETVSGRSVSGIVMNGLRDLNTTVFALYLARGDPRVPFRARLYIGLAAAYLFSPIDLIPDFFPVIGQLDDALIVPSLVGLAVKAIPQEVMTEYRIKAHQESLNGLPRSYFFLVFLLSVIVLLFLIGVMVQIGYVFG